MVFLATWSRVRPCLTATVALAASVALAAPTPVAQSTLADGSFVVVSQQGVFYAHEGQPALQLFAAAAFGGTILEVPSVTWIDGSNAFIITRRDNSGLGGVWRMLLQPNGTASIEALGPAIPAALGRDFTDADYSVGLDTLFLLERSTSQVLALEHPAVAGGAGVVAWAGSGPGAGDALAVRGAHFPFSVLVVSETGEIRAVNPLGVTGINTAGNPQYTKVATNHVTGDFYAARQTINSVIAGKEDSPSGLPQAVQDLNVWQFCSPLAQQPADIEWDARTGRVAAFTGAPVKDCVFGPGGAPGENHFIRLPVAASGPPGAMPVLLTASTGSGILGKRSDVALVRNGLPDITWYGEGGAGAGGIAPRFDGVSPSTALVLTTTFEANVSDAPANAAAFLVMGGFAVNGFHQGQLFGPKPQFVFPLQTGADGVAAIATFVPSIPLLTGLRIYMQWWLDDNTTPGVGDMLSSQVGVFTVGAP